MFVPSGLAARFGGGHMHGGAASRYELPPTSSSPMVDDAISLPSSSYEHAGPSRHGHDNTGGDVYAHHGGTMLKPSGGSLRRKHTPQLTPILTDRSPRKFAAPETFAYDDASLHVGARIPPPGAPTSLYTQIIDGTAQAQGDANLAQQQRQSPPQPPMLPVKPYPPKLNDTVPQTPFDITFGITDGSPEGNAQMTPSKGRNSPVSARRVPFNAWRTLRPSAPADSFFESRDSTYTTSSDIGSASAVVSKANAVSLQRAVASPRLYTEAGGFSVSTAMTTAPTASPAVRLDKSVGVSTRRKPKKIESETSNYERKSSRSRRNSTLSQIPTSPNSPCQSFSNIGPYSPSEGGSSLPSPEVHARLQASASHVAKATSALQELTSAPVRGNAPQENISNRQASKPLPIEVAAETPNKSARNDGKSSGLHSPWVKQDGFAKPETSSDASLTSRDLLAMQMNWRNGNQGNAESWAISDASVALHNDLPASQGVMMYPSLVQTTPPNGAGQVSSTATASQFSVQRPPAGRADVNMQDGNYSIKDTLLRQLMASVALVDAQACPQIATLEEVEQCKRDVVRLEQRANDLQNKLKVYLRVRDAAYKLRRAALQGMPATLSSPRSALSVADEALSPRRAHQRHASSASSTFTIGNGDLQKAESDALAATRAVDTVTRELFDVQQNLASCRERLLQHSASVLAVRVEVLEDESVNTSRYTQESTIATTDEEDDDVSIKQRSANPAAASAYREELEEARATIKDLETKLQQKTSEHVQQIGLARSRAGEKLFALEKDLKQKIESNEAEHNRQVQEYEKRLEFESGRSASLERDIDEHKRQLTSLNNLHATSQERARALEIEVNAQRSLMQENHQLVRALETRLEEAEQCLRTENDHCARMLGKVDGREEMDDLLSQIKSGGIVDFDARQKKPAGQDIEELVGTLSTHLRDLEDELRRAQSSRMRDTHATNSMIESPMLETTTPQTAALREMGLTLQDAQREAAEWRAQAETASRRLEAMQRQSAISMTSSSAVGQNRISSRFSSNLNARSHLSIYSPVIGGRRPSVVSASSGMHTVAELEARIALLEKRNAVLEEELSNVSTSRYDGKAVHGMIDADREVMGNLVFELLRLLPRLDADVLDDLHEVQECLENMAIEDVESQQSRPAQQLCMLVMDRSRSLVNMSRSLVGKALALEMQGRDLEEEIVSTEDRCEELQTALETLRASLSDHMQSSEAGRARERQLEQKIAELQQAHAEAVQNVAAASKDSPASRMAELPSTSWSKGQRLSASSCAGKMVKSSSFGRQLSLLQKSPQRVLNVSISPSPSKISFSASGTSTPATSLPTSQMPWSSTAAAPNSGRWPSSRSHTATTTSAAAAPSLRGPRSMTLGLSSVQLTQRVRELEDTLLKAKTQNTAAPGPSAMSSAERTALVQQLDEANARLEANQREVEELRNVESRQRIALLEEMTTLTADLSAARAELRRVGVQAHD